jgi:hypothetical protein
MPQKKRLGYLALVLSIATAALCSAPATAEVDVGVRGGYYTDVGDPFLGVDLLMRIADTRWFFNPNIEYVFVDPGDLATVNLDAHYDLDTDDDDLYIWLGGGPAIIFRDNEDSGRGNGDDDDDDLGLNLLGGIGWQLEAFVPYVQAKAIIADDSEVVIAVGVRF